AASPLLQLPTDRVAAELPGVLAHAAWIVDALLGTGAVGDPRPPYDSVLEIANRQTARKLAVDWPSGLDCDTGAAGSTTFRADHTCTFVAQKPGIRDPQARGYLGQVHIVD